jgi:hypothetical protein
LEGNICFLNPPLRGSGADKAIHSAYQLNSMDCHALFVRSQ